MRHPIAAYRLWALCLLVSLGTRSVAAPPVQAERLTDHLYRVGKVMVDTLARTVTCPGEIGMDRGAVEYLAVTPLGKTYESLLRISVRPIHLQVALLLLGLEPRNVLTRQGDKTMPEGAPVELTVRWRDPAGHDREVRAEDLLARGADNRAMARHPWLFTGSRILKEGFEAELSGSLIAVWHDPAAVLDNPLSGSDNAWIVNPATAPHRGTPIELVIRALPARKQPAG